MTGPTAEERGTNPPGWFTCKKCRVTFRDVTYTTHQCPPWPKREEWRPLTMSASEEKSIREALLLDGPMRHAVRKILDELEAERATRRATVGEIVAHVRDSAKAALKMQAEAPDLASGLRIVADHIEKTWSPR